MPRKHVKIEGDSDIEDDVISDIHPTRQLECTNEALQAAVSKNIFKSSTIPFRANWSQSLTHLVVDTLSTRSLIPQPTA